MDLIIHTLMVLAVLATAVVYGTDVFCAAVQRPALAHVDEAALTSVMGRVHQYGDRRMPIPGAIGLAAAVVVTVTAAVTDRPLPAALCGVATVSLVVWLTVYIKVSAPVNKQLTEAAAERRTATGARALQHTWDSVIIARALLQGVALVALSVALAW